MYGGLDGVNLRLVVLAEVILAREGGVYLLRGLAVGLHVVKEIFG